jgi:polysaccharide biosynthesis protein PslG
VRSHRGPLAALISLVLIAFAAGCGEKSEESVPAEPGDGETVIGYNETKDAETLSNELIAASGAGFIRVALNWATVEPVEGQRNFAPYDAINSALADNGVKPLWVVTSAPCWAAGEPCTEQVPSLAPDPQHVDDYADFAAEVAERYPDALGIEIWNEPNIPNFWRPAPDLDLYRELLSASADAIHATGSDVPVLMAGPSPTGPEQVAEDPSKIEFPRFIEEVMAKPDAPDVDAIALHPYGLLKDGVSPVEASIDLYEQGRKVTDAVAPDLPVWVTEVGLTTAGQRAVTPEQQANGVSELVRYLADDGVPVIAIHRFFDDPESPLKFEQGFGVLDGDGEPKHAFCAAADAVGVTCDP